MAVRRYRSEPYNNNRPRAKAAPPAQTKTTNSDNDEDVAALQHAVNRMMRDARTRASASMERARRLTESARNAALGFAACGIVTAVGLLDAPLRFIWLDLGRWLIGGAVLTALLLA